MRRNKGISLFEMLFALAVMTILLTVALPDFKTMIADKKVEYSLRRLAGAINFARTSAIKSGSVVTICPSDDGQQCDSDWHTGSLVFSDSNADRKIDREDEILLVVQHEPKDGQIKWRSFQNKQYLQISGSGFTRNQNGNFTYCSNDKEAEKAQQLVINRLGRTRFAVDTDGDGIRENSQGRPLSCN